MWESYNYLILYEKSGKQSILGDTDFLKQELRRLMEWSMIK